jgi:hypothetical protein
LTVKVNLKVKDPSQMKFEDLQKVYLDLESYATSNKASLDEISSISTSLDQFTEEMDGFIAENPEEEKTARDLLKKSFRRYSELLGPLFSTDDALLVPYNRLAKVLNLLHQLEYMQFTSDQVVPLQEELVSIENEYVRDGVFVPAGVDQENPHEHIRKGQAILFGLLNHAHRIARLLVERTA